MLSISCASLPDNFSPWDTVGPYFEWNDVCNLLYLFQMAFKSFPNFQTYLPSPFSRGKMTTLSFIKCIIEVDRREYCPKKRCQRQCHQLFPEILFANLTYAFSTGFFRCLLQTPERQEDWLLLVERDWVCFTPPFLRGKCTLLTFYVCTVHFSFAHCFSDFQSGRDFRNTH